MAGQNFRAPKRAECMKKLLSMAFALTLLCLVCVSAVPTRAVAEAVNNGTCGESVIWSLDDEGTLTISGSGEMASYTYGRYAPWYERREEVIRIVVEDGVTSIGRFAFMDCCDLKDITLPQSVTSIEAMAFCQGALGALKKVFISAETVQIGEDAFGDEVKVTDIYYGGTEEQWSQVVISSGNGALEDATVHFSAKAIPCEGEHTWDDGEVTTVPTCKDEGVTTYICTVCGETKAEPIVKTEEHVPGEAATEEHGQYCTVCGKLLQEALTPTPTEPEKSNNAAKILLPVIIVVVTLSIAAIVVVVKKKK